MVQRALNIAVFGLGNRGCRYLEWITEHPDVARVAALIDPDSNRLHKEAEKFAAGALQTFPGHLDFFESQTQVDAAIIACPDRLHYPIAMEAISRGIHVLIEKPMATSASECRELARAAEEKGVTASVCYELHHHPYYLKINELLRDPRMGQLTGASHIVNSGLDRSLHNFVRGGWSRTEQAGPVFLSKCSHDVDLFLWLCQDEVQSYSSYGSRSFFREENAPQGSAHRCINCPLESSCAFSAVDLYTRGKSNWTKYIATQDGETREQAIKRELENGPLGRCAFRCNNNVNDREMLTMQMKGGAVVNIFMNFLTREDSRISYFSCTGGEIWADWKTIRYRFFNDSEIKTLDFSEVVCQPFHAGSDFALTDDFFNAILNHTPLKGTSTSEALESHLICLSTCTER